MTQGSKLDELTDSSIYLSIKMIRRNAATGKPVRDFALIELPTREFDRFIVLPSDGDTTCIIFLDDVVRTPACRSSSPGWVTNRSKPTR